MLSASDTLTRLGGLATGTRLQELGFSRRSLSRLVQKGQLDRIRPGLFALPGSMRTRGRPPPMAAR